jgi:hypothetical protein
VVGIPSPFSQRWSCSQGQKEVVLTTAKLLGLVFFFFFGHALMQVYSQAPSVVAFGLGIRLDLMRDGEESKNLSALNRDVEAGTQRRSVT